MSQVLRKCVAIVLVWSLASVGNYALGASGRGLPNSTADAERSRLAASGQNSREALRAERVQLAARIAKLERSGRKNTDLSRRVGI